MTTLARKQDTAVDVKTDGRHGARARSIPHTTTLATRRKTSAPSKRGGEIDGEHHRCTHAGTDRQVSVCSGQRRSFADFSKKLVQKQLLLWLPPPTNQPRALGKLTDRITGLSTWREESTTKSQSGGESCQNHGNPPVSSPGCPPRYSVGIPPHTRVQKYARKKKRKSYMDENRRTAAPENKRKYERNEKRKKRPPETKPSAAAGHYYNSKGGRERSRNKKKRRRILKHTKKTRHLSFPRSHRTAPFRRGTFVLKT